MAKTPSFMKGKYTKSKDEKMDSRLMKKAGFDKEHIAWNMKNMACEIISHDSKEADHGAVQSVTERVVSRLIGFLAQEVT